MPTLRSDMISARVPERKSWLKITNSPLNMASAGITGYSGTLYLRSHSGWVRRRRMTQAKVMV